MCASSVTSSTTPKLVLGDMPNCTVFIIDGAGQSLATFDYEGGVPETAASEFRTQVLEQGNQSAFLRVDDEYSLAHIKKGAVYLVGGIQRSEDQDRMLKTLIRVGSELKEQLPDVSPATIVNHRSYVKDVVDQMIEAADS